MNLKKKIGLVFTLLLLATVGIVFYCASPPSAGPPLTSSSQSSQSSPPPSLPPGIHKQPCPLPAYPQCLLGVYAYHGVKQPDGSWITRRVNASITITGVSIIGPESHTGTTAADVRAPLYFILNPGLYCVLGKYGDELQNRTILVQPGLYADPYEVEKDAILVWSGVYNTITFFFGGCPPPPQPPPAQYPTQQWWAGSVYPSSLPTQSARKIYMSIQVSTSLPPPADFYYVLLSTWNSAGSYVQIGFSAYYGVWGLVYSWTSGNPYYPDYHGSNNAMNLSRGVTYTFYITTENSVTYFAAYQGSTKVWSFDAPTGGDYLIVSNSAWDTPCYTNYEEVYNASGAGGAPTRDFYFFDNYWVSTDGTVNAASWDTLYYNAPSGVVVTIDGNSVLIDNPGRSGCPTLFVWNGAEYIEEGVLDIHAESDVTVQHQIKNTLALENGVYKLQLRELDSHTSHIDQVKLYAVNHQGERHLCPLTYAYHGELGKVKHALLFDDDTRVDLEPTEIIHLKFAQSIPYSQTAYFMFEINGYNMKQP